MSLLKMKHFVFVMISTYPILLTTLLIIWLIINVFIAYFVYKDAKVKDSHNALIWAIVIFFTSVFGLLIYLIIRQTSGLQAFQPKYDSSDFPNNNINTTNKFCPHCLTKVESDSKFCPNCGFSIP